LKGDSRGSDDLAILLKRESKARLRKNLMSPRSAEGERSGGKCWEKKTMQSRGVRAVRESVTDGLRGDETIYN